MVEDYSHSHWTPDSSDWFLLGFGLLLMVLALLISARWRSRLRVGQAAWRSGESPKMVLSAIGETSLASGELGYRLRLLESTLRWSLGEHSAAWALARKAHLRRLSPFNRWTVQAFTASVGTGQSRRALRWGKLLLRRVPDMPHLRHSIARAALEVEGETTWIWDLWVGTVPLAEDDPLLLQDLMLIALERIQASRQHPIRLGTQEWSPQAPFVFEEALKLLLHRHGEPQSPWDRTAPAHHLLQEGRSLEALQVVRSAPRARRSPLLCEIEVMALHRIGDLPSAWAALETSLKDHPQSFRLWMERFHGALNLGNMSQARESLELAEKCLPPDSAHPTALEWRLHRAAFAHRMDQDDDLAWKLLATLPAALQEKNAHLLTQVLIALERYEEALEQLRIAALRHPEDLEMRMLQAECLAGTGAWKALIRFLDSMPPEARERAAFWHFRGLAWAHLDDPLKAQVDLEAAARLAPRDLRVILDAGHASADLGDHDQAEEHWRQALHLAPESQEALYQMACTRHAQHDPEGARRFLRECLLRNPDDESAQAFLAELEAN